MKAGPYCVRSTTLSGTGAVTMPATVLAAALGAVPLGRPHFDIDDFGRDLGGSERGVGTGRAPRHSGRQDADDLHQSRRQLLDENLPFAANGVSYSPFRNASYVWHWDCEETVPADAIARFGFDYRK